MQKRLTLQKHRHSRNKALPYGTVAARTSNLEMRPLWDFGINNACEICAATQSVIV